MVYAFENCELDPERYVLRCDGEQRRLEPQVFDVLVHLVRNRGRVVTKEELLDEVWGTRFVSEASLTSRIRAARQAVGDTGSKQAVIRTVRNRGYEFVAPVTEHALPADGAALADAGPALAERGPAPGESPGGPGQSSSSGSGMPEPVDGLIGRDQLLLDLGQELEQHRLITLTGPGGVGKTAVAYELARSLAASYADGVYAVEFVAIIDASATVQALATALDVQPRRDVSLQDTVVDVLRPRRALLVLDNCEHLIESMAELVERILEAAPAVSILATSRQPLAVRGERIWPVEPLSVTELDANEAIGELAAMPAVRLFTERATAADPRFELDESSIGPVVGICRQLDGMPLAIELAAARVRALGVNEIAERLNERFRLLRNVRRGGDPRHHALHDTVQWSYDLLTPDEQRLFDELSVFAGQVDIASAAAVCGERDELDTLDLVTGLAERSMLAVRHDGAAAARYEMLETLRAYGRSHLDDAARTALGAQHAAFHAQLACDVEIGQRGPAEAAANARAEAAFPDLRAALTYAARENDIDRAFALVTALREYAMRSMRYEAMGWADDALACDGAADHDLHPLVTAVSAYGAWIRGEYHRALAVADEVASDAHGRGDVTVGLAERVQANIQLSQGNVDLGMAAARRQLALAEESGQPSRQAHGLYMLSVALSSVGEFGEASELASRAHAIGEASGSPTDLASGWVAHGFAAQDDVPAALSAFAECDHVARRGGNRWMAAFARTEASALQLLQGDVAEASRGLADAVDTWYRAGEWSQQWLTLARCVIALDLLGETELAAELTGAVEQRAAMGTPPVMASLRQRTLAAAEELTQKLGVERYTELHATGGRRPIVDVVHRTRAVLLGQKPG